MTTHGRSGPGATANSGKDTTQQEDEWQRHQRGRGSPRQ